MPEEQANEPTAEVAYLTGCITQYDREFMRWRDRVKKIIQKYRGGHPTETDGGSIVRFNILWSNVQTLVPATFARMPRPDVSRRFRDNDPVGRVAALILQRALEYEVGQYSDYMSTMRQDVFDRFLGGRGTCWVRYEPHMKARKEQVPTDGVQVTEDVDQPQEELDYECTPVDYVHWEDFGHNVARTWEEVWLLWRVVYMDEDACVERFGKEIAASLSYDSSPEKKDKAMGGDKAPKQAKIYEMWDKKKKKACWLSKSMNKILDEREDPLGLLDFWPCPKPLFATTTNDTLVPVPDYKLYEEQARALDTLQERIDGLVKALQVKGVHDAAVPELGRLFTEAGNNDLVPVKNFAAFAEKNGLKGAIDIVDLKPFYGALQACYLAMSQIKEYIYEITGISDIVRGETNANETLGAQQIKQNFVGLRLKDMQSAVAKFASETLSIKGQIICAKYSPDTIKRIAAVEQLSESDKPMVDPAIALLIGQERMQWYAMQMPQQTGMPAVDTPMPTGPNPMRQFRIDIEADSLVQMDEQQDKQDRLEFLTSTGTFIKEAFPVIQAAPEAAPLLVSMLKFGVTAFKVGRSIEGDFDQALDQLKQQALQPKAPPPPDPALVKVQEETKLEQQRMQNEAMAAQQTQKFEFDKFQAETARSAAEDKAKEALTMRECELKAQNEARALELEHERELKKMADERAFQEWKVKIETEAKIEIAMIQAGLKVSDKAPNAVEELSAGMKGITDRMDKESPQISEIQAVRDAQGNMTGARIKKSDGSTNEVAMRMH